MPTRWRRIPVTEDPELTEALARVEPLFPDLPPARLVHDLAIRGADAVARESADEDALIERLIDWSTTGGLGDPEEFERLRESAWGE